VVVERSLKPPNTTYIFLWRGWSSQPINWQHS